MPLPIVPIGQEVTIRKIGLDDKTKKHLESLGITVGSRITVLSRGGGNLIVVVMNSRLCLDGNISSKILAA